jgi:hypothetical protein
MYPKYIRHFCSSLTGFFSFRLLVFRNFFRSDFFQVDGGVGVLWAVALVLG